MRELLYSRERNYVLRLVTESFDDLIEYVAAPEINDIYLISLLLGGLYDTSQYCVISRIESCCPDLGSEALAVTCNYRDTELLRSCIYYSFDVLTDDSRCTGSSNEDRIRMLSFVSELDGILELLGGTEDRILLEEVGAVISAERRGKISSCLLYSVSEVEVSELACAADGSVIDNDRIPDHRELAESLLLVAAEAL